MAGLAVPPSALRRLYSSSPSNGRQWFLRQRRDPWVRAAQQESYRCRAAFKLLQMHQQHHLLRDARLVVDLGGAPGGWSQVAARTMAPRGGRVIAVDLLEMASLGPRVDILKGDFTSAPIRAAVERLCQDQRPDVILSDMSPNISGIKSMDHLRSIELVRAALQFALDSLGRGGHFVAKVFAGRHTTDLEGAMATHFDRVLWSKPEASRGDSSEIYILGLGHRH